MVNPLRISPRPPQEFGMFACTFLTRSLAPSVRAFRGAVCCVTGAMAG